MLHVCITHVQRLRDDFMNNMVFAQLLLLLLFHPGVLLALTADVPAVPAAARKPGCATKCGDIEVPYPFGLDPQCAIHSGFHLNCSVVDGATKLFHRSLEVIRLSVPDGKSWLKTLISRQCYVRANDTMRYNNARLSLTKFPYVLSADDNTVVVIGCDSLAYMLSDSHIIGCLSTCDDDNQPKNGSCSGAGCCQVDLPRGVRYYEGFFNEYYNNTSPRRSATPCNYISVMATANFSFSTTYLTTTEFYDAGHHRTPVVMDWAISHNTCQEAKVEREIPYACISDHSECITNDAGYRCRCSSGYKGNPYVLGGCRDIDECQDNVTYPCAGVCTNKQGTYDCSCSDGKTMINGTCVMNKKSIWVAPIVGAIAGVVLLVIATTCAYLIRERRKLHRIKTRYFRQHGGMLLFEELKSQHGQGASFFKIFSEEELQQATNMFNEEKVIGHGGHGKVYKGVVKENGVEVAVKRCLIMDEQHKKEFGREMLILSQVNHRNIVKLLGCCLEVEVPMLVYEFVPNGTLFQLIHGGDHHHRVSLATRLRIAHESAEALTYLHSCASPPILHGDVKSTNILLDGDKTAKVSDFGASILAPTDKSQFVTLVQGTCGYLDPEYMQTCQLTDKSDVYSFGVVLLELLTRKKAFNLDGPEHEKSLVMAFHSAVKSNRLVDFLDEEICRDDGGNMEVLEEVVELARQCLEMSGVDRPSMKDVADKLDRLIKVMQQHPWMQEKDNSEELYSLLGESSVASTGVVTTDDFSITKKAAAGLEIGR